LQVELSQERSDEGFEAQIELIPQAQLVGIIPLSAEGIIVFLIYFLSPFFESRNAAFTSYACLA